MIPAMTRIKVLLVSLLMVAASVVGFQAPAQAATTYYYAGMKQTLDFDGVAVNASKENPAIDSKAPHSLFEISVSDNAGNTVEFGWIKDATVCGAGISVCLFTFSWKGGVPGTYNGSAVNGVNCAPYCLGASLDGLADGTLKGFGIQHITNAWWFAFDGQWRFMIPDTRWGSTVFQRGKLAQIFGEVGANDSTTCSNMGAGVTPTGPPTLLGGRAGALTYVNGTAAPNATPFATAPTRWNSVIANTTSPPVTSIRYGGTGGC
jgi:hypothetical protein